MAESFDVSDKLTKAEKYEKLYSEVRLMLADENNELARMSTIICGIKEVFSYLWVGVYLLLDGELCVGPYQGPLACLRIGHGRGVCGTALAQEQSLLVGDVSRFPGHIACSSRARSEIVVPLIRHGKIFGVLDVDSEELNGLDLIDLQGLEKLGTLATLPR